MLPVAMGIMILPYIQSSATTVRPCQGWMARNSKHEPSTSKLCSRGVRWEVICDGTSSIYRKIRSSSGCVDRGTGRIQKCKFIQIVTLLSKNSYLFLYLTDWFYRKQRKHLPGHQFAQWNLCSNEFGRIWNTPSWRKMCFSAASMHAAHSSIEI